MKFHLFLAIFFVGVTFSEGSASGRVVEGKVQIRTLGHDTILLPPGQNAAEFSRVVINDPALAGVLRGLGTYYIAQTKSHAFQPLELQGKSHRTFSIYHSRSTNDMDSVTKRLDSLPSVENAYIDVYVDLNWSQRTTFTDASVGNNAVKFEALGIPLAHTLVLGTSDKWIAVVDSGVGDIGTNDLSNQIAYGSNLGITWTDHGTGVAGLCCALPGLFSDTQGIYGAAPVASFASYTPVSGIDILSIGGLMEAADSAIADGAGILNLSWGIVRPDKENEAGENGYGMTQKQYDEIREEYRDNANAWIGSSALIVVAAPNEDDCIKATGQNYVNNSLPSDYNNGDNFLVVGGETSCNVYKDNTDGSKKYIVNISAPTGKDNNSGATTWVGQMRDLWNTYTNEFTTDPDGTVRNMTRHGGTSFAAPVISGIANLLYAWNPNLTKTEVRDTIISSARTDTLPNTYSEAFYGAGYVNAYDALLAAERLRSGVLYAAELEVARALGLEEITFTIKEGKTKSVSLSISNPGDGVLYFEGLLGRCVPREMSFCGSLNDDIRWTESSFPSSRYRVDTTGNHILEGYLGPNQSRSLPVVIDATNLSSGSFILGIVYYSVYSEHGDRFNSSNSQTPFLIRVNVVRDSLCVTSVALQQTPSEPNIEHAREFRDVVMVPREFHGAKWVQHYYDHGNKIIGAFDKRPDLMHRYRAKVDQYVPVMKAKVLEEMGLSNFTDVSSLDHVITDNEAADMAELIHEIVMANPEFEPVGKQLTQITNQVSGLRLGDAIEYVLSIEPIF